LGGRGKEVKQHFAAGEEEEKTKPRLGSLQGVQVLVETFYREKLALLQKRSSSNATLEERKNMLADRRKRKKRSRWKGRYCPKMLKRVLVDI